MKFPLQRLCGNLVLIALLAATGRSATATDPAALNEQGVAAHRKRDLGEASRHYRELLKLDPPAEPTAAQLALVYKFAPRPHHVAGEFFPLKDIVAIIHPDRPVIGYHLFWEDDLGFPSDNDPCDHEIVWIQYDPATGVVTRVFTYFHGRILAPEGAAAEANAHGGRAWIGVEWGFHGSIPWQGLTAAEAKLREHWGLAHQPPPGRKRDPLARGWPESFPGGFDAYVNFGVPNDDALARLQRERLVFVSRWPMASLNRYCLRYNFAAKTEWPWLADSQDN